MPPASGGRRLMYNFFMVYLLAIIAFLGALLYGLFYLGFYTASLYLAYLVIIGCIITMAFIAVHFYRVFIKGYAPYLRSSSKLIREIISKIDFSAKGGKDQPVVYELGCGDGRFLRALAKNKKIKAVGIENFILPYALAAFFNIFVKNKIKLIYKDFFKIDLSQADYVFCYLMPRSMDILEEKLGRELKPGAVIISNTFRFKSWPLEKEIFLDEAKKAGLNKKLFIYKKA